MSSDEEEDSGDEEQQPAEELEPTQEFHDQEDGNATPPYGVGGDDGDETEPDDDGEATEAEDDEPEPAPEPAVDDVAECTRRRPNPPLAHHVHQALLGAPPTLGLPL